MNGIRLRIAGPTILPAYGVSCRLSPRGAEVPDQPSSGGRWLGPLGPAQPSGRVQCPSQPAFASQSARQEVSSCLYTSTGVEAAVTNSPSC